MSNLNSKRFVIRKSLIGKNQIINFTTKSGVEITYNHDIVYVMIERYETSNKPLQTTIKRTIQPEHQRIGKPID